MKVEIIEPHGLCAGVNGAIAKALKLRGVYCLHELVHNEIVIAELKDLGFTFVDDIEDVPEGETVVRRLRRWRRRRRSLTASSSWRFPTAGEPRSWMR